MKDHADAIHKPSQQTETFPCEWFGLVFGDFSLLEKHVQTFHHVAMPEKCHCCDKTFDNKEDLKSQMIESHEELVIMHNIAQHVENLTDNFSQFETFKLEMEDVLKKLLSNQNILQQELFLIRNNQAELSSRKKLPPRTETPGIERTNPKNDYLKKNADQKESEAQNTAPKQTAPEAPPTVKQSEDRIDQVLIVGDSISGNLHVKTAEIATKAKIRTVKAYSSIYENVEDGGKHAPKFPSKNFNDVIKNELKKDTRLTS